MDMNLRFRLAEWLAYHLSCFEYVWPWSKWEHVLTKPEHDGQRYQGLVCCADSLLLLYCAVCQLMHCILMQAILRAGPGQAGPAVVLGEDPQCGAASVPGLAATKTNSGKNRV